MEPLGISVLCGGNLKLVLGHQTDKGNLAKPYKAQNLIKPGFPLPSPTETVYLQEGIGKKWHKNRRRGES